MKIHIVLDDGTLVDTIEEVDESNFQTTFSRAALVDELEQAIGRGQRLQGHEAKRRQQHDRLEKSSPIRRANGGNSPTE